jgi:hypothetical protein
MKRNLQDNRELAEEYQLLRNAPEQKIIAEIANEKEGTVRHGMLIKLLRVVQNPDSFAFPYQRLI